MGWTDGFKALLRVVAPSIGSAIGGPAGGVAAKFLSEKLLGKPDASDTELEQAVLTASPETLLKIKEIELEYKKFSDQLGLEHAKLEQQTAQGQVELNKLDAQSGSIYKGGWRPGAGWVCVSGLAYAVLGQPLLVAGGVSAPTTDVSVLITLLFALLGLGAYRTREREKGVISQGM